MSEVFSSKNEAGGLGKGAGDGASNKTGDIFHVIIPVRFAHTDPAGIVFYPRYFEMLNQVVEDWFAAMDYPFKNMIVRDGFGVPTVSVQAEFMTVGVIGDQLEFTLVIEHLGNSSCRVRVTGQVGGEVRVIFKLSIVFAKMTDRASMPWPEDLRARMAPFQEI